MRMEMDNRGAFGVITYPGSVPADSLGLEYPIGAKVEHLFGGGLWIGGLLDTSQAGGETPLRLVTTFYEGWAEAPLFEGTPGNTSADTIWRASRRDTVEPPGWSAYWGGSLPFRPISDNDFYCTYTDTPRIRSGYIPLRLKVIQSSYAWNDPYADAIIINEYRIVNMGRRTIDSAYIGWFVDADVGPINVANYWTHDFTAYISNSRTAYIHNPQDAGSTPVGAALLWPPDSPDLRYTFQWFPGSGTPANDDGKYTLMSLGQIKPDEYPNLSDTRFFFSFGPFFMRPATDPLADTLKIAVAIVSGYSRSIDHRIVLQNNAARALNIYLNQGIQLPATPPSPPLRVKVGFRRVELDWKWQPGDETIFGRYNPEANWDTTSRVAERDPMRFQATHLGWDGTSQSAPTDSRYGRRFNPTTGDTTGFDTTKGGRNFEAYRVWRSEVPKDPGDVPDLSYTLLRQVDVIENVDSAKFEYETGMQYTFVDSNLVRGKTYVYSVTSLSIPNFSYVTARDPFTDSIVVQEVPVNPLESAKNVNAVRVDLPFAVSNQLGKVSVVPNPYRTDRDYTVESGGYEGLSTEWTENKRVIKFINLPEVCTIRVFSLAGDLIRTIRHDGRGAAGGFSRGDASMSLLSESNRALASGIYIFTVESPYGTQTGKFVVIR